MITESPWGPVKHCCERIPGVFEVFPEGAMGPHLMIDDAVAQDRLSGAARRRAIRHEGFYCFGSERGGAWTIAVWEIAAVRDGVFESARCIREQGVENYLHRRLMQFQKDYLAEQGLLPNGQEGDAP
jgi:hypothetical protein